MSVTTAVTVNINARTTTVQIHGVLLAAATFGASVVVWLRLLRSGGIPLLVAARLRISSLYQSRSSIPVALLSGS